MADYAPRISGPAPSNPNNYNPIALANTLPGTPLAQSQTLDATMVAARANSANTAYVQGLASSAAAAGEPVHAQYAGPLTLTTAQWDAICGTTGGLNQGVPYYLSTATAGKLSATPGAGAGNFIAPVGVALSATTMNIQILPVPIVIAG